MHESAKANEQHNNRMQDARREKPGLIFIRSILVRPENQYVILLQDVILADAKYFCTECAKT